MAQSRGSAGRLAPAEVKAELEQLTATAGLVVAAHRMARIYVSGLRHLDADDLLREAMTKLLAGERKWPRGYHAMAVLQEVMHSIASNERKKHDYELLEPATAEDGQQEADVFANKGTSTSDPAVIAEGQNELEAITQAVAGDEDAELLVEALADGLKRDAAIKELGWDPNKYDAVRKRLVRRLDTLATNRRR